jgi:hypothetical protein
MSEVPRQNPLGLAIHTFKKMRDRRVKQVFSRGGYHWGREGIRKGRMRVNMVDGFCIHT